MQTEVELWDLKMHPETPVLVPALQNQDIEKETNIVL